MEHEIVCIFLLLISQSSIYTGLCYIETVTVIWDEQQKIQPKKTITIFTILDYFFHN